MALMPYDQNRIDVMTEELLPELEIDESDLFIESIRSPIISYKISSLIYDVNIYLIEHESKLNKLYLKLYNYYSGKASPEEYKEKPFHLKVLKADINKYIEADDDYIKLNLIIKTIKNQLTRLANLMSTSNGRSFHIRNANESQKFKNGLN